MKILIAYDGTECSDTAIADLSRAGLPADAEVEILSIATQPISAAENFYAAAVGGGGFAAVQDCEPVADTSLHNAGQLAAEAAIRLRSRFPRWRVGTQTWADEPQSAILRKARGFKPDLIVVGCHDRSRLGRLLLGSVSRHVLNHAECSVRVSRHHLQRADRPVRLVIGADGSDGAHAAVRAVARRSWPEDTEVRVIGVVDTRLVVAAMSIPEGIAAAATEEESLRRVAWASTQQASAELSAAGLHVTPQTLSGVPAAVLIAEAEVWGADSIFVGARGLSGLERVLLGSAASAVALRARCSVEVVRNAL